MQLGSKAKQTHLKAMKEMETEKKNMQLAKGSEIREKLHNFYQAWELCVI